MLDLGAWLARWNMSLSVQEQIIHSGPWATISSFCFFLGALVGGDLLVLRGALLMAYVFMLVNGLTGAPVWPFFNVDGRVNIDMVLWALMSGCLHGLAVARMLIDELPVRFLEFDDEQMARFLNRRSGMERLEARETLRRGKWLQVKAGHRIVSSVQLHEYVYLLVEGKCGYNSACCFPSRFQPFGTPAPTHHHHTCLHHDHGQPSQAHSHDLLEEAPSTPGFLSRSRVLDDSFTRPMSASTHRSANIGPAAAVGGSESSPLQPKPVRTHPSATSSRRHHHHHHHHHATPQSPEGAPLLRSGHIFSLSALNVFGVYIGFDQDHGRHLEVWAESDCLLYCWPMSAMEEMATSYSPALAAYWRNLIMYSLANEFEHRAHRGMSVPRCSTGEHEAPGWLDGARSRDFTDKLRPYEIPNNWSWPAIKRWLTKSLSPFPPHGIRHTALPTTGIMARTRAMAVADARAQAAEAAQAELESLAACEICSHQLLSPRTAAAVRHRQETAWIQTWRDTPAVQETSLWAGLPTGCAVEVTEREFVQQQLLEQHQQHRHRAMADDVKLWVADKPALDGPGAGSNPAAAAETAMWWQQQQDDEEQQRQKAELDLLLYQQQEQPAAVQPPMQPPVQPAVYKQQTSTGRRPVDSASSSRVLVRQQTAERFKPPAPLQLHLLQQQQQQDDAAGGPSSTGTAARFYAAGVVPTPGPAAPAPSPALLQQQLQQQQAYQAASTSAWLAAHPIAHDDEEAITPEATTPVGMGNSLAAPLLGQQMPAQPLQQQAARPSPKQRQQQQRNKQGGRGRK